MFFLSGLPRSGSTLLQTILSQNPNIYVDGNSALCQLMWDAKNSCEKTSYEQLAASDKLSFQQDYIKSIPSIYYKKEESSYIIDKSRAWTLEKNLKMIRDYIEPDPKIIVVIRPIKEIVKSFKFITKDIDIPQLKEDNLLKAGSEALMLPLYGIISAAKNIENKNNLLIVTYEDIIETPSITIDAIYKFLGIPTFNHNFQKIEQKTKQNDYVYGIPDLHKVREKIEVVERKVDLSKSTEMYCNQLDYILNKALENLL